MGVLCIVNDLQSIDWNLIDIWLRVISFALISAEYLNGLLCLRYQHQLVVLKGDQVSCATCNLHRYHILGVTGDRWAQDSDV